MFIKDKEWRDEFVDMGRGAMRWSCVRKGKVKETHGVGKSAKVQ